jgi:hypothetical protein
MNGLVSRGKIESRLKRIPDANGAGKKCLKHLMAQDTASRSLFCRFALPAFGFEA